MVRSVVELAKKWESQGFTVTREILGVVDSSVGEYNDVNSDSLCHMIITNDTERADVVWYDNGYVSSLFVCCDNPVFRQSVADAFFG